MKSSRLIQATCPECRGSLTEIHEDGMIEYTCLVGHRYSPEALLHAHSVTQERALWSAVVALEEAKNIVTEVAPHLPSEIGSCLRSQADEKAHQAQSLRKILGQLSSFRTG